ncbi:ABC transporter permease [Rhodococcus sp. 06-412-2C]|nr:ABC transporter permease [Rhodococcus sp. 06-412-2C]OZC98631.1 ABC transporter permease [Rhodococcus sp. 06-412-2B]
MVPTSHDAGTALAARVGSGIRTPSSGLSLVTVVTVTLLAWGIATHAEVVNRSLLPSPSDVWSAALDMSRSGTLWSDIRASLTRSGVGFLVGAVSGITVGFLTGRIALMARLINPFVVFLRPIPVIALVPLVTAWFGIGEDSKYLLISYAVFLTVWLYVHDGVARTRPIYLQVSRMLGTSRLRSVVLVLAPASAPAISVALRLGAGVALLALVAAELGGTQSGIAYRLQVDGQFLQTDRMFVGLIVLGVLGTVTDGILAYVSRRYIRWEA